MVLSGEPLKSRISKAFQNEKTKRDFVFSPKVDVPFAHDFLAVYPYTAIPHPKGFLRGKQYEAGYSSVFQHWFNVFSGRYSSHADRNRDLALTVERFRR